MPSLGNDRATAQARGIQAFLMDIEVRREKSGAEKSDDFSKFMLHYADYDYSY
jgi:hypothetical protein